MVSPVAGLMTAWPSLPEPATHCPPMNISRRLTAVAICLYPPSCLTRDCAATLRISPMGEGPGPRSRELQAERDRYLPRGMSSAMPVFAASGTGATLTDVDGQSYIDFATGISVMNVGHGHPRVVKAIREQAERLVHSGAPVMMPEAYVRLARRLCEITPGAFPKKALLLNSGAEAVENAVKVVRQATGRPAIISFHNSFHGRTLMSMTLTGKVAPYRQNFGPYAPEVYQVPYPYEYRRPAGMAAESLGGACVEAVRQLFKTTVGAARVAGIEAMFDEKLPERGAKLGGRALARMRAWMDRFSKIGDVRGRGAMVAMELVTDRATREPAGALTNDILRYCHGHGLAILKAGLYDNVIRLLFALVISEQDLDRGLDILEEALVSVNA